MKNEKRIGFLDIMKGIGIILVVMGHTSENFRLSRFIYSFHMPLFFWISGYVHHDKPGFVKNKIRTILVPYFSFALITYGYWFFFERAMRSEMFDAKTAFVSIFLGAGGMIADMFSILHYGFCHASL